MVMVSLWIGSVGEALSMSGLALTLVKATSNADWASNDGCKPVVANDDNASLSNSDVTP